MVGFAGLSRGDLHKFRVMHHVRAFFHLTLCRGLFPVIYRDRKEEVEGSRRELLEFLNLLRLCVSGARVLGEWELTSLYRPSWWVRDVWRRGSYHIDGGFNDSASVVALHYVRGCCGHHVEREILRHPRLCALWAGTRVGGRWLRGEDMIGSDHFAMWMYASRVLRGRLPSPLHNRIMMESYMGRTEASDLYLGWLAQNFVS